MFVIAKNNIKCEEEEEVGKRFFITLSTVQLGNLIINIAQCLHEHSQLHNLLMFRSCLGEDLSTRSRNVIFYEICFS